MASTSDREPADAAEDRDPDRPDADEHKAAIRELLTTFADWMRDRSRRIARRHDLDADDVFQLTWGRRGPRREAGASRRAASCRTRTSAMTTRLSRSGERDAGARHAPASAAPHGPDQQHSWVRPRGGR